MVVVSSPVQIPADVERPDQVLGPLTARQVGLLGGTGLLLYTAWTATKTLVPVGVWAVVAVVVGVVVTVLVLGWRDGIGLDRYVLAAARYWVSPRYRVAGGVRPVPAWLAARAIHSGPDGGEDRPARGRMAALELPATAVHPADSAGGPGVGVVDLGGDGLAVIAVASTVNFALRTPVEQDGLVGGFARWLHSLAAPVQLLIRAHPLDLTGQIRELRERAPTLPHPALEAAAVEHAEHLAELARSDLLRRQVLLILREPAPSPAGPGSPRPPWSPWPRRGPAGEGGGDRRAAEVRLGRRLGEALDLAGPAGIVLTPLDAGQATAVLAAACCPGSPLPSSPGMAGADDIITTTAALPVDEDGPAPAGGGPGRARGQADEDTQAWARYWAGDTPEGFPERSPEWGWP